MSSLRNTVVIVLSFLNLWGMAFGQAPAQDSTPPKSPFVVEMQQRGSDEAVRSRQLFEREQISRRQRRLLDELARESQQLKFLLRKDVDTSAIKEELKQTKELLEIVKDGVFVNKGTSQTHRNLTVSSMLLDELVARLGTTKQNLDRYMRTMNETREKLDSLQADSALYIFPDDSIAVRKYLDKLTVVVTDFGPLDSSLNATLNSVSSLQIQSSFLLHDLREAHDDVDAYRKQLNQRTFKREFHNIWGEIGYNRPFGEIVSVSVAKEKLLLQFYLANNQGRVVIFVLLVLLVTWLITAIKKRLKEEEGLDPKERGQLVVRYPWMSSIVIVFSIFQFIFFDPPFIFSFVLWFTAAIALTVIFRQFITPFWMRFWLAFLLFFVLASLDNFILQASRSERWFMFFLSIAGIIYGGYILKSDRKQELRERKILYFIAFVVILQVASLLANTFGRFNLSKTYFSTGYVGLIIAILFLWAARLFNETLKLASHVYKHPDRNLFYINFEKVGDKVPGVFYVFLVIGWFILIGRNFYSFKQITQPILSFITDVHTIGGYEFSISGILIFATILVCSMYLSRLVSFFGSEPVASHEAKNRTGKIGIGSWLLLVRIFIISMGLFIALSAAGISLDKITIIIGALGVGIGLGLQSIVNNLVSGLIIAFEKPVNVGDNIEVNGKPGVMKEIGFRSSMVTLLDGSILIIPNGDLLSQHLINWSKGKNVRKITSRVSVVMGTEIDKVKSIALDIVKADERVMAFPAPSVGIKEFANGAIDFDISYWIKHIRDSNNVNAHVLEQLTKQFDAAGIKFAHTHQDIVIQSLPDQQNPSHGNSQ